MAVPPAPWPERLPAAAPLIDALVDLRRRAVEHAEAFRPVLDQVPAPYRTGADNLMHYLAVRQHDLRPLHQQLARLGLSSLSRAEAATLFTLDAVLDTLHRLDGRPLPERAERGVGPGEAADSLEFHCRHLLGPRPPGRGGRIMVTAPSEAADDPRLVRDLLAAGMDLLRVNCAHDDSLAWQRMAEHLQRARADLGRPCGLYVDLAGPKLRTGAIEADCTVRRVKVRHDPHGNRVRPARLLLHPAGAAPADGPAVDARLPLQGEVLDAARVGDELRIDDARGRQRRLTVVERWQGCLLAEAVRTLWARDGARVQLERDPSVVGHLGPLAAFALPLVLRPGDPLHVVRPPGPGRPATVDANGRVVEPASIPCTLERAFVDVRPGDPIFFDDGEIEGTVTANDGDRLVVRILRADRDGSKLRSDKGINLPATDLRVPALTDKDRLDLDFACAHGDIVGLSFVRTVDDVDSLHRALDGRGPLGTVLKIETGQGFRNLGRLLLAGLKRPPLGVMVARGDLAVEVGFGRLAEVQEQVLWLAEAAQVPVIWATQVLEGLAKRGAPSRAEVTDAAMAGRAECVMLNKGPHIVETVRFLDNVLGRMQGHLAKNRAVSRRLSVSELT